MEKKKKIKKEKENFRKYKLKELEKKRQKHFKL